MNNKKENGSTKSRFYANACNVYLYNIHNIPNVLSVWVLIFSVDKPNLSPYRVIYNTYTQFNLI